MVATKEWITNYEKQYAAARQMWKQTILDEQDKPEREGARLAFFSAYTNRQFAMPVGAPV